MNNVKENEIPKNPTIVDLDEFLSCGVSYDESIRKLQELKGTPYSVTFLPAAVVASFDPQRKDWEYQKYAKVQYDILQLHLVLKSGLFSRGGKLKVSNTLKANRGYVFQHSEVLSSDLSRLSTSWKVSQTLKNVQDTMLSSSKHTQTSGLIAKKCYLCQ